MLGENSKSEYIEDAINLIIIGDQFVGKTSLMKRYHRINNRTRFTEDTFSNDVLGTIGRSNNG
jgi:hypothetical protein